MKLYLAKKRVPAALALFPDDASLSNAERLLKAKIFFAQLDTGLAIETAEQVFKASSLSGEYTLSLDASLLLAQFYQSQKKPEQTKAKLDFIQKNATRSWQKSHQAQLQALGMALVEH